MMEHAAEINIDHSPADVSARRMKDTLEGHETDR